MLDKAGKNAIVVGAGAGGIATAARLAKAGYSVLVVEKNSFAGGRCSMIKNQGYRFDQGPSLLLLPKLFKETFYELDTSIEAEGVELLRCPTNYNVWFSDGENFELSTDLVRMKEQIERWEGKDGFERYLSWLQEAHRHYEISCSDVLANNFTSFWDLARPAFVWSGIKIHPLHSIWNRASKYFWSERLRRVFTFATMYMGMSPFDAPATYSLLQYTELAEGIWYPRGGFYEVLAALKRVGERLGVEYRLDAPVQQILTQEDGKTVRGVQLESGEILEADVVVINADLVYAYSNLFPQQQGQAPPARKISITSPTPFKVQKKIGAQANTPTKDTKAHKYAKALRRKDGSCSSISFYWSLDRKIPELQTHNIFLADEYRESFDSIFKGLTLPEEPSFYINVPSRIDPSASPEGCDAVIALVPTGHLLTSKGFAETDGSGGIDASRDEGELWTSLVDRARSSVLSIIASRTKGENFANHITNEIVNDPLAWEDKFNLDKGSILGLSHSFFNVLSFRPQTRARHFENCYFVGASTHPGTGVPIVLACAKIVAEQILDDRNERVPWRGQPSRIRDQGVPQNAKTGKLDRIHAPVLQKLAVLLVLLLLWVVVMVLYWR